MHLSNGMHSRKWKATINQTVFDLGDCKCMRLAVDRGGGTRSGKQLPSQHSKPTSHSDRVASRHWTIAWLAALPVKDGARRDGNQSSKWTTTMQTFLTALALSRTGRFYSKWFLDHVSTQMSAAASWVKKQAGQKDAISRRQYKFSTQCRNIRQKMMEAQNFNIATKLSEAQIFSPDFAFWTKIFWQKEELPITFRQPKIYGRQLSPFLSARMSGCMCMRWQLRKRSICSPFRARNAACSIVTVRKTSSLSSSASALH